MEDNGSYQNGSPTQDIFDQMPGDHPFVQRLAMADFPSGVTIDQNAQNGQTEHTGSVRNLRLDQPEDRLPDDPNRAQNQDQGIDQGTQKRKAQVSKGIAQVRFLAGEFFRIPGNAQITQQLNATTTAFIDPAKP